MDNLFTKEDEEILAQLEKEYEAHLERQTFSCPKMGKEEREELEVELMALVNQDPPRNKFLCACGNIIERPIHHPCGAPVDEILCECGVIMPVMHSARGPAFVLSPAAAQ